MARGRMINKKISNSKAVNDLPEPVQLLYTWLIPHLDCNGCFYGSAQMIKSLVFPRKNYSKTRIENWLKLLEKSHGTGKSPLITRYFVNGEQYLFMPGFTGEQIGLRRDKEKPEFPPPDGENTETAPTKGGVRGREVEVEQEVEEGEGRTTTPSATSILKIFNQTFPYAFGREPSSKEQAQLRDLAQEIYSAGGAIEKQVKDAFGEAASHNKMNVPYVRAVLLAWIKGEGDKPWLDRRQKILLLAREERKRLGRELTRAEIEEIERQVDNDQLL